MPQLNNQAKNKPAQNLGQRLDISLVIPIYNALNYLKANQLYYDEMLAIFREIIFIDGGSTDASKEFILNWKSSRSSKPIVSNEVSNEVSNKVSNEQNGKIKFYQSKKGRGSQLAHGAALAQGEYIFFSHVDSILLGAKKLIKLRLSQFINSKRKENWLGYGKLVYDKKNKKKKLSSFIAGLVALVVSERSRYFKLPYGDQGLLISKKKYLALGGFNQDYDIMEDVDFILRAKKANVEILALGLEMKTSFEKYEKTPLLRIVRNQFCLTLFFLKVHPKKISHFYR